MLYKTLNIGKATIATLAIKEVFLKKNETSLGIKISSSFPRVRLPFSIAHAISDVGPSSSNGSQSGDSLPDIKESIDYEKNEELDRAYRQFQQRIAESLREQDNNNN